MSEGEYSISTDYLNILNSKVNNLYDFIQKNNDANHSINTFSNETNMTSSSSRYSLSSSLSVRIFPKSSRKACFVRYMRPKPY